MFKHRVKQTQIQVHCRLYSESQQHEFLINQYFKGFISNENTIFVTSDEH